MGLQSFLLSKYGVGFAIFLARILPPRAGYAAADFFSWVITLFKKNPQVQAVRANQWIISGKKKNKHELDRAVREVFRHSARCIYDMYHYYQNLSQLDSKVILSSRAKLLIEQNRSQEKTAVVVGPHLSNFDLGIQALARNGMKALILSYPQPTSGYQWQNEIRNLEQMETVPLSISVLHQAVERLSSGEIVITGVERPVSSQKYRVNFFGEPACLPVMHIQLALKTMVPVVVIGVQMRPDQIYEIDATEEIPMVANPDHNVEITSNAEAVLARVEELIGKNPCQWLMFYPVWPQAIKDMP
jgi:lauroyl/myristoyl acyltransferase